jgi:putative endonuclease
VDKYYVGVTTDVDRRLQEHLNPIYSKYTSQTNDWEVYLVIPCFTKTHALRLERFIKKMKSKSFIQSLAQDDAKREAILSKTASDS